MAPEPLPGLRAQLDAMNRGIAVWRCDDHEVIDLVASLGGAASPACAAPRAYRIARASPAAAASPPSAPARAQSAAMPPPTSERIPGMLSADLDAAAMVQALLDAAQSGVPFCEECERARQQQRAAA